MAELPKVVWHRLRPSSAMPEPKTSVPVSPAGSRPADHPDANLLAAFLDRSLTERERGLVLAHLAECDKCREQVSLALPETEVLTTSAEPASVKAPRSAWGVRRGLAWGALAASFAIILAVILRHPQKTGFRERAARVQPLRSAEKKTAPAEAERPAPKNLRGPEIASVKEPAAPPPAQMGPGGGAEKMKSESQSRLQSHPRSLAGGSVATTEPTGSGAASQPTQLALARRFETSAPRPLEAPEPPRDKFGQTRAVPGEMARDNKTVASPSPKPSQTALLRAPATPAGPAQSLDEIQKEALAGRAAETRPAAGTLAPAQAPQEMARVASLLRWTVSSSGKVERSLDGGRTWKEVNIDKNTSFRTVAAAGADVWAGGSKGALYHSLDYGVHWTRVGLTRDSTRIGEDIVSVHFIDPQHGTVTTAAGKVWTTSDGGQSWK